LLSFLPLIIGLSNLFCFQTLIPLKQEKLLLPAVLTGCVCSLVLNCWLIPIYGATGAAVATLATELGVTLLTGFFAHRHVRFSLSFSSIFQTVSATGIMMLVTIVIQMMNWADWIVILIGGIGGLLIYGCLQWYIFNNQLLKEAAIYLKQLTRQITNG
jgi:O-antigen/teichoic acid export membrane protein